jgi:hypothetical protein
MSDVKKARNVLKYTMMISRETGLGEVRGSLREHEYLRDTVEVEVP